MGADQNQEKNSVNNNSAEILFDKAAKILIDKGFLDDCINNETLDSVGIDRVITKTIHDTQNAQGNTRICLHIQIKQGGKEVKKHIKKHQDKYPVIPIMSVSIKSPPEIIADEIIMLLLECFQDSRYFKNIDADVGKYFS